jgi:hypothetical protein
LQAADAHLSVQAAALGAGLPVIAYRVARPTLEDVFLRLVEA